MPAWDEGGAGGIFLYLVVKVYSWVETGVKVVLEQHVFGKQRGWAASGLPPSSYQLTGGVELHYQHTELVASWLLLWCRKPWAPAVPAAAPPQPRHFAATEMFRGPTVRV